MLKSQFKPKKISIYTHITVFIVSIVCGVILLLNFLIFPAIFYTCTYKKISVIKSFIIGIFVCVLLWISNILYGKLAEHCWYEYKTKGICALVKPNFTL